MREFSVSVGVDHISALSRARKPVLGIAELIWNALDADATRVRVVLTPNDLRGIESIEVEDNGTGIPPQELETAFGQLGDSWKRQATVTKLLGRVLHGKKGVGRYRALAIGNSVTWETRYSDGTQTLAYTIEFDSSDKRKVRASDPVSTTGPSGTRVLVHNVTAKYDTLSIEGARAEITEHFALYLRQYPNVQIIYDGHEINPSELVREETELPFEYLAEDGVSHPQTLTILEWKVPIDRALFLCSRTGFSFREMQAGIHAPGVQFTAYLRSEYIEQLEENNSLEIEIGDLGKLIEQTREKLRQYNLQWQAKQASEVVAEWKQQNIYPYEGSTDNPVEQAQRQVFDVVAASVAKYLPDFKSSKTRSKKLTFNLLRQAIETSPSSLRRILEEVMGLPKQKQDELAMLLEKTSLSAIISASKIVSDRLEFIQGLRSMLFEAPYKPELLERKQLQRLVAANTWLFGEEYFLMNDDESLLSVLRSLLGTKGYQIDDGTVDLVSEVEFEGGGTGVVDLALTSVKNAQVQDEEATPGAVIGKTVARSSGQPMHNLVIELKRPTQKITPKVIQELRDYAFAIAKDERFSGMPARWTFWALSNQLTEQAQEQASQRNMPPGVVYQSEPKSGRSFEYTIIAKAWGEVLDQAAQRLEFFRSKLVYSPSFSQGREFLRATYSDFIPRVGDFVDLAQPVDNKAAKHKKARNSKTKQDGNGRANGQLDSPSAKKTAGILSGH
jgi:hypothetical protein